jgi:replicative DNA helicase
MTPSSILETGLPAAVDAERTLLGAVLLDSEAWPEIAGKLRPIDFSLDSQRIGRAMKRVALVSCRSLFP